MSISEEQTDTDLAAFRELIERMKKEIALKDELILKLEEKILALQKEFEIDEQGKNHD